MNLEQSLENFGGLQQTAALHLLGVFFKPHLPIGVQATGSVGKIGKDTRDLPGFGDPAKTNVGCVGKRDQHRYAVVTESEQIKPLEDGPKGPGADVLDRPNPLVGIHDLITDLEGHTGSPTNHRESVAPQKLLNAISDVTLRMPLCQEAVTPKGPIGGAFGGLIGAIEGFPIVDRQARKGQSANAYTYPEWLWIFAPV